MGNGYDNRYSYIVYHLLGPFGGSHNSLRWSDMPPIIQRFRNAVLGDMDRFNLDDSTLIYSAICHPGFKHFEWIREDETRYDLLRGFLIELCNHECVEFDENQFDPNMYAMANKRYIRTGHEIPSASVHVYRVDDLLADDSYFQSSQDQDASVAAASSVYFFFACCI